MDADKIIHGDCLAVMKTFPDESIDLIATDPPYGLEFMNKGWDKVVPSIDIWKQCFRILRAGAFMFVMSSARQDVLAEMIVRLRTAGFRTDFPSIYWTYSQGFPKASDIALAIDKRECLKELTKKLGRKPSKEEVSKAWKEFRTVVGVSDKGCGNTEGTEHKEAGFASARDKEYFVTEATTPLAKSFDGSYGGFQPKPAVEIIIVVMKPLSEKSFVDQALKNRKGITWLEEGRIPASMDAGWLKTGGGGYGGLLGTDTFKMRAVPAEEIIERNANGRFVPNLLVSDDILNDGREYESKAQVMKPDAGGTGISLQFKHEEEEVRGFTDTGSFSRFFDVDAWWERRFADLPKEVQEVFPFLIVPKPSESEKHKGTENLDNTTYIDPSRHDKAAIGCNNPRNRSGRARKGNIHATVKPIKLFSYLVTLGSEKNDVVLDPFVGSGTTCLAAKMMGRKTIGIEKEKGYFDVAKSRFEKIHKDGIRGTGFFG